MFNWFKKKTIVFDFSRNKVTIDKRVTPEEAALMILSISDGSLIADGLTKNGHKNAKERIEFIKDTLYGGLQGMVNQIDDDDDAPAISPTSMVNFGPKQ